MTRGPLSMSIYVTTGVRRFTVRVLSYSEQRRRSRVRQSDSEFEISSLRLERKGPISASPAGYAIYFSRRLLDVHFGLLRISV